MNANRICRLYNEMGLQLRNKTPKRRVKAMLQEDRTEAPKSNETWAMNFVHDQLATGRKIRDLTIVDTFPRFSPATDPRVRYRGEDVVQTLERLCRQIGDPHRSGQRVQPATLICVPIKTTSSSTSRGQANQPTTLSPTALAALSERSA